MKTIKTIENLYQEIAAEAVQSAPDLTGKLLFAADIKEGVVSSALVYEKGKEKTATFKFSTSSLIDLAYELWEKWKEDPKNSEWIGMELTVSNGKFEINFTYPDQIDSDEDFDDRRQEIFDRHFIDKKIDYSNV
ncbi:hypothetical protein JOD97_000868 [Duganella sp. 1411]|uniref:immunity protein YezG family protein n=1 Tax=Duganella sp. 1411 TaxID=2806572 RepID=UPI001AE833B6|nr:immunity protein YezG family protein [Duganella sp. 1411]MBP1202854.1 hypothetical protein [Duganella sp. 1411]